MPILEGVMCRCDSAVEVSTVYDIETDSIGWRVYCTGGALRPVRRTRLGEVGLPLWSGEDPVAKGWMPALKILINTAIKTHRAHQDKPVLFSLTPSRPHIEEVAACPTTDH